MITINLIIYSYYFYYYYYYSSFQQNFTVFFGHCLFLYCRKDLQNYYGGWDYGTGIIIVRRRYCFVLAWSNFAVVWGWGSCRRGDWKYLDLFTIITIIISLSCFSLERVCCSESCFLCCCIRNYWGFCCFSSIFGRLDLCSIGGYLYAVFQYCIVVRYWFLLIIVIIKHFYFILLGCFCCCWSWEYYYYFIFGRRNFGSIGAIIVVVVMEIIIIIIIIVRELNCYLWR